MRHLIQNSAFRPKPEGTILAEEKNCELHHNMTGIFFFPPCSCLFCPHPAESSLIFTFIGSTSYFSCPLGHAYQTTWICNNHFLFLSPYLGWSCKIFWKDFDKNIIFLKIQTWWDSCMGSSIPTVPFLPSYTILQTCMAPDLGSIECNSVFSINTEPQDVREGVHRVLKSLGNSESF